MKKRSKVRHLHWCIMKFITWRGCALHYDAQKQFQLIPRKNQNSPDSQMCSYAFENCAALSSLHPSMIFLSLLSERYLSSSSLKSFDDLARTNFTTFGAAFHRHRRHLRVEIFENSEKSCDGESANFRRSMLLKIVNVKEKNAEACVPFHSKDHASTNWGSLVLLSSLQQENLLREKLVPRKLSFE